jgi:competence protein ComGC
METFIMIVMLCHIGPIGQEACIPLVENPPIYYKTEKDCNDASIKKRKTNGKNINRKQYHCY